MNASRLSIVWLVAVGIGLGTAHARGTRSWSYRQLYDGAELVVIAKATKTRVRTETAPLPGMMQTNPGGATVPVMGQRIETELEVMLTLKGSGLDAAGKPSPRILLHHYSDTRTGPIGNGPSLVSFDPKTNMQYLLFLVRGKDGQYVALSGQTDPSFAIEPLRNRAP